MGLGWISEWPQHGAGSLWLSFVESWLGCGGQGMEPIERGTGRGAAAVAMRRAPGLGFCRAACKWRLSVAFLPLFIFSLLVPPPGLASSQLRLRQACSTCRGIVDRFRQVSAVVPCTPDSEHVCNPRVESSTCDSAYVLHSRSFLI